LNLGLALSSEDPHVLLKAKKKEFYLVEALLVVRRIRVEYYIHHVYNFIVTLHACYLRINQVEFGRNRQRFLILNE